MPNHAWGSAAPMTGITHHSCGATEINRRRVPCGDLEWYRWTMACEHKRASKPTVTTSIVPTSRRARASTHHSCKSKRIAAAATTAQDQVRSLDLSCVEPCASEMCYTARPGSRNGEENGGQWCGKQTLRTHALRRCCLSVGLHRGMHRRRFATAR